MARLPYKQTKQETDYHTTTGPDHCAVCTHFQPPFGCEKVTGKVAKNGWCKLFAKET